MTGYKLTDKAMRTYTGCVWKLGEYKTASGVGELCSSGWLHFYRHPLLAVLHNPIHAGYEPMRLFECDVAGKIKHDGYVKSGTTSLALTREIEVPVITITQKIAYGILAAKKADDWSSWAAEAAEAADKELNLIDIAEAAMKITVEP